MTLFLGLLLLVAAELVVLVEVAERIPLNEGDAKRTKSGVERTMVAHLEAFDREADGLDRPGHLTALVISLL